jgi:hypothetical protein
MVPNRVTSPKRSRQPTPANSTKATTRPWPTTASSPDGWSRKTSASSSSKTGGWDHHGSFPGESIDETLPIKCRQIDQAITGLITDLKQLGIGPYKFAFPHQGLDQRLIGVEGGNILQDIMA